jgi:hypothetical protein
MRIPQEYYLVTSDYIVFTIDILEIRLTSEYQYVTKFKIRLRG